MITSNQKLQNKYYLKLSLLFRCELLNKLTVDNNYMEDPSKSFKSEDNLGNLASWSTITQTTSQTTTKRDRWKGKIDFLIACMGFSIGLGNVWRFPYLCYKNGGGKLLKYFIIIVIIWLSLTLIQLFGNKTTITVANWNALKFIGFNLKV
ncbi:uncharacterized protein DC041_0009253 [Schistosoma bovis]|uniref:Transporter n=1 Tax=Schistosoma bovis TaxID=6184 RepID=A0A430Q4X0_SCHBO|nr:uncharacterized protein DC041_0009253 [Schistosoma bovis]